MASPVGSIYVQLGIDSAEFKRGLKSAQDSAKVFGREIDRAASEFGALEARLDPAVAALRQYQAAQKTVADAVRFGAATQQQANAVLAQAAARYQATRAPLVQAQGTYRGFGNVVQQAGYQVGDFAVQVASGQGVLRPFIQQGTQLVSMFGPWGAAVGAAGAVVGALAVAFLDAGEAAEDAAGDMDEAVRAASGLESAIGGLESVVDAYASAIAGTASAQVGATDTIVAQTKREFEAKKQLLELERARSAALLETTRADTARLQGELAAVPKDAASFLEQQQSYGAMISIPGFGQTPAQAQRAVEQAAGAMFDEQSKERIERINELQDGIKRTSAEAELLAIALERTDAALGMSFEDMVAQRSSGGGRGGGGRGGGGSKTESDAVNKAVQSMRERIQLLQEESRVIGMTEDQRVRLTAAFERERLVREVLLKAEQDGIKLTPEQIVLVEQHAAAIEELTIANHSLAAATEAQATAAEEAKRQQEELASAVADTADRFISAVQQADNFADAIRNLGLELLKVAIQGAAGEGPLGSFLGPLVQGALGALVGGGFSVGGGAAGYLGSSFGAATGALSFHANGGIADGWAIVGERGRELVHFGERARVHPNAETERMMRGGDAPEIHIHNNVGAEVSTRERRTDSGMALDVLIDNKMAAAAARQGSRFNQAATAAATLINR